MTNRSADIGASGVTSIMGGEQYRPYPAYKDSGVEWLREIPEHWEVARADSLFRYEKIQIEPSTISEQSIFHYSIPAIQETGNGVFESPADIDSAKLQVFGHRLLVSKLNPRKGVVLVADEKPVPTICSTEFVPLEIRSCDLEWAFYLYSSEPTRQRLSAVVRSATRSHQRAEVAEVLKMWHGVPPHSEQRAIAAFLDRETAQIDALVAKKKRLIELLQEKRTALISDAVTKGLDPDVLLKDSGVEWLGEIPAHWEVEQLNRVVTKFVDYRGKTPEKVPFGVPLVTAKNIKNQMIDFSESQEYIREELYPLWMVRGFPESGDVVVTTEAPLGESAQITDTNVALAQRIILLKADKDKVTNDYLKYHFVGDSGHCELQTRATGSTAIGIKASHMKASLITIPPIIEQRAIAAFLDRETSQIDALETKVQEAIDRLKELRTALISAAVTGKIDVRETAA